MKVTVYLQLHLQMNFNSSINCIDLVNKYIDVKSSLIFQKSALKRKCRKTDLNFHLMVANIIHIFNELFTKR